MSIFQICIYCQDGQLCQTIDCLFYGTTDSIEVENNNSEYYDGDDNQSLTKSFQLVIEITNKLGIAPGGQLFSVFKQLLHFNKKISRNILSLATIYYTSNLEFYFPIYNLLRYCENLETSCSLHQKFIKIWIKAKLDPPPENADYVLDYISSRERKKFPPKYSKDISKIMYSIKDDLHKMQVSNMKLPVLVVLGYYFYVKTSSESDILCDLLRISKSVVNRNKSFVMQSPQICYNLRSLNICINL